MDFSRVERLRVGPEREILLAHSRRQETTGTRTEELDEAVVRGGTRHPESMSHAFRKGTAPSTPFHLQVVRGRERPATGTCRPPGTTDEGIQGGRTGGT